MLRQENQETVDQTVNYVVMKLQGKNGVQEKVLVLHQMYLKVEYAVIKVNFGVLLQKNVK